MKFSHANVEQEDRIVAEGVGVFYETFTNPRSGMSDWRGYFEASPELIDVFWNLGNYRLALEDGRAGDIVVNNVDFTFPQEAGKIHFLGAGPLE